MPVSEIQIRLATEDDRDMEWYDFSGLKSVNECPTFGLIRYVHKKAFREGRAMALEAGSASHEFFAAVRMLQLMHFQGLNEHAQHHGPRLFGNARWTEMMGQYEEHKDEDQYVRGLSFCLSALYSSGFYDDPRDKRRTMANIEESCTAYYDKWKFEGDNCQPVWVRDKNDPEASIGIELDVDLVIEYSMTDGSVDKIRYAGKLDGLHHYRVDPNDLRLSLHENKTASRLNDAWSMSFLTSHQVTGYWVYAALYSHREVKDARVFGMCIPLPRSYDYGGLTEETVTRHQSDVMRWAMWVRHTVRDIIDVYRDVPDLAPRYTHSCSRYFRPCSLIPYCSTHEDDERETMFDEMVTVDWNPLESKYGD